MNNSKKVGNMNELLSSCQDEDTAVANLIYLTNKRRGEATTENHIRKCYRNRTLGALLKRLDPIAFNVE